jgi:hypothetical protein
MFWGVMDKEEIVKLYIYGQITDKEHKQSVLIIACELKSKENYNKIKDKIDSHIENDYLGE